MNLLDLIRHDTPLRRTSAHRGGEYSSPCPFCRRGTDRFKVWPACGRWACLGASAGRAGCDRAGDAIAYLRQRDGLSYADACAALGYVATIRPARTPQMLSISVPAPLQPPAAPLAAARRRLGQPLRSQPLQPSGQGRPRLAGAPRAERADDPPGAPRLQPARPLRRPPAVGAAAHRRPPRRLAAAWRRHPLGHRRGRSGASMCAARSRPYKLPPGRPSTWGRRASPPPSTMPTA